MAVTRGGRAPYAPFSAIKTVIEKHRQVGIKTIDQQRLVNIGISETLAPRTVQSLINLDFIDPNGRVTPEFDALRMKRDDEFKPALAALLRNAYAEVLENIDPATATAGDVENAFRGYEPTGQLGRITSLFTGLMTYAELMPEGAAKKVPGPRSAKPRISPPMHQKPPSNPMPPAPNGTKNPAAEAGQYGLDIELRTGGTMALSVNVDPLRLRGEDRAFFYKVVDMLLDYGEESMLPGVESSSQGENAG